MCEDRSQDPSRTVDRAAHLARVRERRQQDISDMQKMQNVRPPSVTGPSRSYHHGKPLPTGIQRPSEGQPMRKGYKSLRRSQGPVR